MYVVNMVQERERRARARAALAPAGIECEKRHYTTIRGPTSPVSLDRRRIRQQSDTLKALEIEQACYLDNGQSRL